MSAASIQYPTAKVSGGAPVPSSHPNADEVPGRTGVCISSGQSAYESAKQPQAGNPAGSGGRGVTGTVTGGARVSPVPDVEIISAFRRGLDSVSIAEMFNVPESAVWSALSRKTPR